MPNETYYLFPASSKPEFNLYFRYPNDEVRRAPGTVKAADLNAAEMMGRTMVWMLGKSELSAAARRKHPELLDMATAGISTAEGLPEFDHAEPLDHGKSEKTGLCDHGVAAKHCRICK